MKLNFNKIILTLFFILSFLFLFIFKNLNFQEIINIVLQIKISQFWILLTIYGLVYIVRTYRFHIYFKEGFSFYSLFIINCIYNFFNNFIPAKIGELSLFSLLKHEKIKNSKILHSIIIFRLYDTLILIFLFFIGLYLIKEKLLIYQDFILILFLSIFLLTILFRKKLINLFFKINFFKKYEEEINELIKINPKLIISSILIFSISLFFNWYLLFIFGYKLSLINIIIAVTIPLFIASLPIPTIAGIGSVHAGWIFSLTLLNISLENAIYLSIVLHGMQIIMVLIYSTLGILLKLNK